MGRMGRRQFLGSAMLVSLSATVVRQPAYGASGVAPPPPYQMPETESWDMTSADGQQFRIYVSRPEGKAPPDGHPVLYVLDGNALFAGFAEARRIRGLDSSGIDKMIIVGIGHPGGSLYDKRRMFDFTAEIGTPALKAAVKDSRSGGRDSFAAFLFDQLRPAIEKRYKAHPFRQSLFGHSLGGLFALHVLYTRPSTFHTIIAASPSVWWDSQSILAEERKFAERLGRGDRPSRVSRLLILAGENEEDVIVSDARLLTARLEALSAHGVRSELRVLSDETHLSVPSRAVNISLRHAIQWP